jgi:hypothetical protein
MASCRFGGAFWQSAVSRRLRDLSGGGGSTWHDRHARPGPGDRPGPPIPCGPPSAFSPTLPSAFCTNSHPPTPNLPVTPPFPTSIAMQKKWGGVAWRRLYTSHGIRAHNAARVGSTPRAQTAVLPSLDSGSLPTRARTPVDPAPRRRSPLAPPNLTHACGCLPRPRPDGLGGGSPGAGFTRTLGCDVLG